jgi:hypothetical protein
MPEESANPFDEIDRQLAADAREFAERLVAAKRADLRVPVTYNPTVRSKPGEPPRRETGNLQGGIEARVFQPEPGITEVVLDSPAGYAERLQLEMNRPIFNDVPERFADDWAEVNERAVTRGAGGE